MSYNWEEYYKIASFLNNLSTNSDFSEETVKRNVISRIYYFAYCSLRNYAQEKLHYVQSSPNPHKDLPKHFNNLHLSHVAFILETLRRMRNNADYDDCFNGNYTVKSNNAIEYAETILGMLNRESFN